MRCWCVGSNGWRVPLAQWVQQQQGGGGLLSTAVAVTSGRGAAATWEENVLCLLEMSHVARCCRMQRPCSTLKGEHWVKTTRNDEIRLHSDHLRLQADAGACGFGPVYALSGFMAMSLFLTTCKKNLRESIKNGKTLHNRVLQTCARPEVGMGCWSC